MACIPPNIMPLIDQFLIQINQFVKAQDADQLKAWLQVDPSSHQRYHDLGAELRKSFRDASQLDKVLETSLPQDDDAPEDQGTAWPGFVSFMKEYLGYWRDANFDDLFTTHQRLIVVVGSCGQAFSNPTYGTVLLRTCLSLSEALSRLTMTLHRRPDLVKGLKRSAGDEDRKGVAEIAAECIQNIFKICTMDRSSGRPNMPEGKKVGMYKLANLVLKLLFATRKIDLAKMIFVNINSNSPALSHFPASERIAYLYYLGRFFFIHGHYVRASQALQDAYVQTPAAFVSHRTNILTYLIPTNMLIGLYPSENLTRRPETQSLNPIYMPICHAIRTGNWATFQQHLKDHWRWLWDRGIFIALNYRLRNHLWRTLSRKVFMLTYVPPTDTRKAATLDLRLLFAAATFCQRLLEGWTPAPSPSSATNPYPVLPSSGSVPQANAAYLKTLTKRQTEALAKTTLVPPPDGMKKKLRPDEGLLHGNMHVTFEDVEMKVCVLIRQGMMHGFVAHSQERFAIIGTKAKGSPLLAGWPSVYRSVRDRKYREVFDLDEVPAYIK